MKVDRLTRIRWSVYYHWWPVVRFWRDDGNLKAMSDFVGGLIVAWVALGVVVLALVLTFCEGLVYRGGMP